MSDERDLVAAIAADSAVQALIQSNLYYMPVPQGTAAPYAAYSVIVGDPNTLLTGVSQSDRLIVEFNCYAKDIGTAKAIARAIRDAAEATSGCRAITGIRDFYETDVDLRRVSLDVSFHSTR